MEAKYITFLNFKPFFKPCFVLCKLNYVRLQSLDPYMFNYFGTYAVIYITVRTKQGKLIYGKKWRNVAEPETIHLASPRMGYIIYYKWTKIIIKVTY